MHRRQLEKEGSKHSGNGDCEVNNRDQGKDKQRKMREQEKKKESREKNVG